MLAKPVDTEETSLALKSKLLRGLADPSRLSILEALRSGPLSVSDIVRQTGLSQPNASMHLRCLFCCGLVNREVSGRFKYYSIASRRVLRILEAAEAALAEVGQRVDQCPRYETKR